MSYLVPTDLAPSVWASTGDIVALTDYDGTGVYDAAAQAVAQTAIDSAQTEVDGYLAKVFTTPLPSPPAIVVDLTARLAVFRLKVRAGCCTEKDEKEAAQMRRDLQDIADGDRDIGLDDAPVNTVSIASEARVFTRGKFRCI